MNTLYTKIQRTEDQVISPEFLHGDFKAMEHDISCVICSGIVVIPTTCGKCHKLFCKKCIDDWIMRNPKCPFDHDFEEMPINALAKNLLNLVKLKCVNGKSGCTKEILYGDYIKHIDTECEFRVFVCSACNFTGSKNIVSMHVNVCENFDENCGFCHKLFKRKELSSHISTCEEKTLECEFCEKMIKKYEYVYHQMSCEEKTSECTYCHLKIKKKNEAAHTKDLCFKEYANNLKKSYEQNSVNKGNINSSDSGKVNQFEKEKKFLENQFNLVTNEKNRICNLYNDMMKSNQVLSKEVEDYKKAYEQWKAYAESLDEQIKTLKGSGQSNVNCVNSNKANRSMFK